MQLVVAATEKEMAAFAAGAGGDPPPLRLVSGVGPLETAVVLTRFLEQHHTKISAVVNFGIGGAYLSEAPARPGLLDVCLAEREVLGDFGVCFGAAIEPFDEATFPARTVFELDRDLRRRARGVLEADGVTVHQGTFITVNGASGSRARGEMLRARYRAICENMEGAAAARVCAEFGLPLVEVRALSNLVEDRPGSDWQIDEAVARAAAAAALIVADLGRRV